MKKKNIFVLAYAVTLSVFCLLCGCQNPSQNPSATENSSADSPDSSMDSPNSSIAAREAGNMEQHPEETLSLDEIESLSSKKINYGYGSKQRDDKNRPNDCVSNETLFSKYDTHCIGPCENIIYLTFDEGYENGYTDDILDILKEKNVHAAFFVTKHYAKECPEIMNRMIAEGHTIGNHSARHPSGGLPSLSIEDQIADTKDLENFIMETYHYKTNLYRFPAGIYSEQSMALLENMGYKTLFWSFAYKDWIPEEQPQPEMALSKMVTELHPGAIYLLHAVSSTNTSVLDDFIDAARKAGYEFGDFS